MMLVEIENLTIAPRDIEASFTPDETELGDDALRLSSDVKIKAAASRRRTEVHLNGKLTTSVEVNCDRCAEIVAIPVNQTFDAVFIAANEDAQDEVRDLAAEDLSVSTYEGETLDLADFAREQILLALDTRILCRENCKGLCPDCGANLNEETCACRDAKIDPRWAGLAQFKTKTESN